MPDRCRDRVASADSEASPEAAAPCVHREPAWSGPLTAPLAARVPPQLCGGVVVVIKTIHTAVFFSVASLIAIFAWDGMQRRPRRRTAIAAAVALAEAAVYVSNNQVCPLSPLAEELGSESGSVTDIFLPDWLSRRIPLFSGSVLVLGLVLNGLALRDGRRWRAAGSDR